jgi:hypothetical protein
MWHVWQTGEAHKGIWYQDLKKKDHLEDLRGGGRVILKLIKKGDGEEWTGLLWHRIGTCGGRL